VSREALIEEDERPPVSGWVYERHAPEHTLLYRVIAHYYPKFVEHLAREGRQLPAYVQREFHRLRLITAVSI
jgi:hypothetical protein